MTVAPVDAGALPDAETPGSLEWRSFNPGRCLGIEGLTETWKMCQILAKRMTQHSALSGVLRALAGALRIESGGLMLLIAGHDHLCPKGSLLIFHFSKLVIPVETMKEPFFRLTAKGIAPFGLLWPLARERGEALALIVQKPILKP